jgi:hypothetical protein
MYVNLTTYDDPGWNEGLTSLYNAYESCLGTLDPMIATLHSYEANITHLAAQMQRLCLLYERQMSSETELGVSLDAINSTAKDLWDEYDARESFLNGATGLGYQLGQCASAYSSYIGAVRTI